MPIWGFAALFDVVQVCDATGADGILEVGFIKKIHFDVLHKSG
jgi:hypothetical protein